MKINYNLSTTLKNPSKNSKIIYLYFTPINKSLDLKIRKENYF